MLKLLILNNVFQVNVLMHTDEVTITPEQLDAIKELKKKHHEQDQREFSRNRPTVDEVCSSNHNDKSCSIGNQKHLGCEVGNINNIADVEELTCQTIQNGCEFAKNQESVLDQEKNDDNSKLSISSGNRLEELEAADGGALWDIFRRQDIPKLHEYLNKYFWQFRHTYCCPLTQVLVNYNLPSF